MAEYVTHPSELRSEDIADYRDHARTYYAFLHLLRWIVAHLFIVLAAVYCFGVANQPLLGTAILILAFAVAIFGIVTTPSAAHHQVGEPARPLRKVMRLYSQ